MVKFQYQVKECDRVEFESIYKIANAELLKNIDNGKNTYHQSTVHEQRQCITVKESSEKLMVSR